MPEKNEALGRLIANENSASDLLAFLFERDPEPLVRMLGLPDGEYGADLTLAVLDHLVASARELVARQG